jgi:hypothetical protein
MDEEEKDLVTIVGCRFPLWGDYKKSNGVYCGKRKESGKPYCKEHCDVMYTSRQKKKKCS